MTAKLERHVEVLSRHNKELVAQNYEATVAWTKECSALHIQRDSLRIALRLAIQSMEKCYYHEENHKILRRLKVVLDVNK